MGHLDAPQAPVSDVKTIVNSLIFATKEWRNAIAAQIQRLGPTRDDELRFRCNICGRNAKAKKAALGREQPTCSCGSSVRLRALIHHLTQELFGASLAIPDIPMRPDIIGIDMSGARLYADRLARRLGYTNTLFCIRSPTSISLLRGKNGCRAATSSFRPMCSSMLPRRLPSLSAMSCACYGRAGCSC